MNARRIILASRSPRRRELLEEAGWIVDVQVAPVDDGDLDPGDVHPAPWTEALAWLKARSLQDSLDGHDVPIVAADTVCVHRGRITGQPRDANHARAMIEAMCGADHDVWTGYSVLAPDGQRRIGADRAVVTMGQLDPRDLEHYLATGQWRGKAGAYNLLDRVEAGWPITWSGEASTVMGLPLAHVSSILEAMEVTT